MDISGNHSGLDESKSTFCVFLSFYQADHQNHPYHDNHNHILAQGRVLLLLLIIKIILIMIIIITLWHRGECYWEEPRAEPDIMEQGQRSSSSRSFFGSASSSSSSSSFIVLNAFTACYLIVLHFLDLFQ